MSGTIYLIPVTLGGSDHQKVIPDKVLELTGSLRFFVVEDLRSARRYLKQVDRNFPIDETLFYILNEHTAESEVGSFLSPVINGKDMGLMSEAGLPGIADPGAKLIALAHKNGIKVTPLSGPSSIIMALISSGLNGQSFSFNGYLPVKPEQRALKIKELEKKARLGDAQIFMETPYRNQKLFESLLAICSNETKLCLAVNITLPDEFIKTKSILEWKRETVEINDRPAVFILQ